MKDEPMTEEQLISLINYVTMRFYKTELAKDLVHMAIFGWKLENKL